MAERVPIEAVFDMIRKAAAPAPIRRGRERQQAVWAGAEPDYLPLIAVGAVPERKDFPSYDLKEQFHDPEKMLYEQLWGVLATLRGKSDAAASVRVNFGRGFLASVFGLEQEVFTDKMPWLRRHLAKSEISCLTPESLAPLSEKGLLPECRRYIQHYRERLDASPVRIYLPDTQGAFDVAHLVLGDAIFTELYDDPGFVRHLLSLTSYVYREASFLLKSWVGERAAEGTHGHLWMAGCGVRSCEDTTTLLSPSLLPLALPHLCDSVAPFGAWVHFCGTGHHLLDPLLDCPEVRGLNFGNPERYDWDATLSRIAAAGKVYIGAPPRRDKEPLAEYFGRVLAPLRRKSSLIFMPTLRDGETPQDAMALWHRVQDEKFG